jgi:hypothetical protein
MPQLHLNHHVRADMPTKRHSRSGCTAEPASTGMAVVCSSACISCRPWVDRRSLQGYMQQKKHAVWCNAGKGVLQRGPQVTVCAVPACLLPVHPAPVAPPPKHTLLPCHPPHTHHHTHRSRSRDRDRRRRSRSRSRSRDRDRRRRSSYSRSRSRDRYRRSSKHRWGGGGGWGYLLTQDLR